MREDRWQHVLQAAFLLEEELGRGEARALSAGERERRVGVLLDSILEVFPSSIDPVDDFEGFAVRRLAQTLRRALRPE